MPLIMEANYSKKLGLPGYSSHQFMVTVRVELSDLNQVASESHRLYALLQTSVDQEIQKTGYLPDSGKPIPIQQSKVNGHAASDNDTWLCSAKQRGLILKIVEDQHLDKRVVDQLAQQRFSKSVKHLNKLEASGLIEELLEQGGKPNGHARQSQPMRP